MKIKSIGLIAALAICGISDASASFVGDTVDLSYAAPTASNIEANFGTQVVNPQANFTNAETGIGQVIVNSDSIVFNGNGSHFVADTFNGFEITDGTHSLITNVSLGSSTVPGFTASDISFSANSVFFNLEGLTAGSSEQITLDVTFSSAVPEPSTWAMMILGFAGIGFMAYRRRQLIPVAA
jgi:hypothetical protein